MAQKPKSIEDAAPPLAQPGEEAASTPHASANGPDAAESHDAAAVPGIPPAEGTGLSAAASALIAGDPPGLAQYLQAMEQEGRPASQAARVVEEALHSSPQLGAPQIARLVKLLLTGPARSAQTAASCLPLLAKVAPAKVARHLDTLRQGYAAGSDVAKDGMVRVFVALCVASVAYQRRVIDVLEQALASAEPKLLVTWTELALPALKGEPHAQARAVVENRLHELPKPQAQRIADFLGIKLRLSRP